tara:strand:- start:1069 stop:1245 length:177 start_codon:yes stop_codon:yes gene_type:complete
VRNDRTIKSVPTIFIDIIFGIIFGPVSDQRLLDPHPTAVNDSKNTDGSSLFEQARQKL